VQQRKKACRVIISSLGLRPRAAHSSNEIYRAQTKRYERIKLAMIRGDDYSLKVLRQGDTKTVCE